LESLTKVASFSSKLGIGILEAAIEGVIEGGLKLLGPEKLRLMVDNHWFIMESIFFCAYNVPIETYAKMSKEEIAKAEKVRISLAKSVLPVVGMAKRVASMFPPKAVEAKVTPQWLITRGEKRFPELVEVWRNSGGKGEKWLQEQADEIVGFLTGRLVYSPWHRKMVPPAVLKQVIEAQQVEKKVGAASG
jgi:hypothetical protein